MFLVQDLKGLGYEKGKPVGLVGVTELSDAQKKQLKEQQEVRPWGAGQAGSQGLVEYRLPPCPVVRWSRRILSEPPCAG